jgi:hypothetical protein
MEEVMSQIRSNHGESGRLFALDEHGNVWHAGIGFRKVIDDPCTEWASRRYLIQNSNPSESISDRMQWPFTARNGPFPLGSDTTMPT